MKEEAEVEVQKNENDDIINISDDATDSTEKEPPTALNKEARKTISSPPISGDSIPVVRSIRNTTYASG